ncbi:MAG: porin [Nitrospirota bacterium]|jgi:hypothetical protein
MKRIGLFSLLAALALPLSILLVPDDADAIPAFARQVKQKCTYCHVAFPKLNEFGITFKSNGYRLQGTKGTDVWDIPAWPVAALTEIELEWDDYDKDARGHEDALTIMQPEVEVFWGTTLGPRISTFGEIIVERGEGADLGPVFIQYNDLVGEAQANLRAGAYDVDFTFLSAARSIIFDGYAAEDLGFFGTAVGLEANGQILPEDEGLTVRYAVGYTLDDQDPDNISDANQSDLSDSFYGTVELTFMEQTVGLHYQHQAGDFADADRWAIAAELHGGGAILTLAWFDASMDNDDDTINEGDDLEGDDLLVELLYPYDDYVFGARWENLNDDGFTGEGDREQWTLHASWYTRPNVQLGAELRFIDFDETSSGADDDDEAMKGRLIARFGF